jgi:hypothetical protein
MLECAENQLTLMKSQHEPRNDTPSGRILARGDESTGVELGRTPTCRYSRQVLDFDV